MILRKRILISIIVAAICLFGSTASAADNWQWYECDVTNLGTGGLLGIELRLSGKIIGEGLPSGIGKWYEIHPGAAQIQKEIFIVALTSVILGKKVEVLLIPEVTKSIYAIYLKI